jgi:hypothetical protein
MTSSSGKRKFRDYIAIRSQHHRQFCFAGGAGGDQCGGWLPPADANPADLSADQLGGHAGADAGADLERCRSRRSAGRPSQPADPSGSERAAPVCSLPSEADGAFRVPATGAHYAWQRLDPPQLPEVGLGSPAAVSIMSGLVRSASHSRPIEGYSPRAARCLEADDGRRQ